MLMIALSRAKERKAAKEKAQTSEEKGGERGEMAAAGTRTTRGTGIKEDEGKDRSESA